VVGGYANEGRDRLMAAALCVFYFRADEVAAVRVNA